MIALTKEPFTVYGRYTFICRSPVGQLRPNDPTSLMVDTSHQERSCVKAWGPWPAPGFRKSLVGPNWASPRPNPPVGPKWAPTRFLK